MGTHRSRHNKGRKPFYKEHRRYLVPDEDGAPTVTRAAEQILSRRAGPYDEWYRHFAWESEHKGALKILARASADIDQSGISLGRSPRAVAWKAREIGFSLPSTWSSLIASKRIIRPNEPLLCYPYVKKSAPDHGDLLRANDLVPKGMSEHMRADICQNVMLALYEGTVTLDEIELNRASIQWFIKKFRNEQTPWQEVQDYGGSDDDERPYQERAVNRGEERYARFDYQSWTRPDQIQRTFINEVTKAIAYLPNKQAAVVRALANGFDVKDIAIRLNLPLKTAQRHIDEARAMLWQKGIIEIAAPDGMGMQS